MNEVANTSNNDLKQLIFLRVLYNSAITLLLTQKSSSKKLSNPIGFSKTRFEVAACSASVVIAVSGLVANPISERSEPSESEYPNLTRILEAGLGRLSAFNSSFSGESDFSSLFFSVSASFSSLQRKSDK